MRSFGIVLVIGVALACAGEDTTARTMPDGPGPGSEEAGGGSSVTPKVINAAPRTFEVPIADDARQRLALRLESHQLEVARLTVHGVRPREARALKGVRLFVDKPDADLRTPVDDPHYAGSFVLGLEDSQTLLFNLAPTLDRLSRAGSLALRGPTARKSLQITFVPEPWEFASALPAGFALELGDLTFEVAESEPRRP
jgi:hypothetical protein